MLFIYWLEDHPQYTRRVDAIHSRMGQRHDQLITGTFTFGEVLAGAYRKATTSPANLLVSDYTLCVDASLAPVTVNLPLASTCAGRIYQVKKTDATGNKVTITPTVPDLVDGAATLQISTQYVAYDVKSDGVSNWWIF